MNRQITIWEHEQAEKLLAELNGMVGSKTPTPSEFRDWNMRARTFLVFAACQRIANGDLESTGLSAAKESSL